MEIAGGACDKAAKGVVVVVVRLSSLYVAAAAAPLIPQSVVGRGPIVTQTTQQRA